MSIAVGSAMRNLASVQYLQKLPCHNCHSPAISWVVCGKTCRIRHGLVCGYSSSTFLASETPFSFLALVGMTAVKPGFKSLSVQARWNYQQNEDLPPSILLKSKKKPYVKPIQHGSHAKRMKRRELNQGPQKPLKSPENGMLVERLTPVAHVVYDAYLVVLDGVSKLLKHLPVKACRWCSEVHVGREGHEIKTCQGKHSTGRNGKHLWVTGYLDDIIVPLEAFHLMDRLQKPIRHEDRFKHNRIPAIVELCIQAGLDLPEFPTLRRTSPIDDSGTCHLPEFPILTRTSVIDNSCSLEKDDGGDEQATSNGYDGSRRPRNKIEESFDIEDDDDDVDDAEEQTIANMRNHKNRSTDETGDRATTDNTEDLERSFQSQLVSEMKIHTVDCHDDLKTVAEKTLYAWDRMRGGAAQLMQLYPVRVCGYCPEVHIGRRGHKLQLCGSFKHQWRNGQHGWQDAALDDLIPPRFVWHVRDMNGPPLSNGLAKYYGKAPAIVELCIQAGADIPTRYKPRMRLDVTIPDQDELDRVA